MAQQSNPVVRLLFEFDFAKREFVLRFESRTHATAYQAVNPEARILEGQPRDVWLPCPPEMISLRSSFKHGMLAVFQSLPAARKWHKQTCLGDVADLDGGQVGVFFQRDWSFTDLEKRLGSRNLKPLPSLSRQISPMREGRFEIKIERQHASVERTRRG